MDPTKNWAYVDFYYADLHLPECSGVYAVFAARAGRDICIYVGQSVNMRSRWSKHHKTLACLREGADFIRYLPIPETELNAKENYYIEYYEPALNLKFAPGRFQAVSTSSVESA